MNGVTQSKNTLWVVIVIVVLAVLLLGYYYFSYKTPSENADSDVSLIEGDLQALPIEGLDSELNDIEKEL